MKRNAILHGVTALCSALVYAFYALPFYTVTISKTSVNSYDYIDAIFKNMEYVSSTEKFAAVAGLLLLLVAGLAFVASVVLLLCDFEVIKNALVAKIAAWATLVLVVLLVVTAVMNLVANIMVVNKIAESAAGAVDVGITAGWAMTILTTLCALGACGTTAYAHFKK